jgi:Pyruvate/2-oxoacid:ferredoxin oxidoreductase delta subunit
MSGTNDAVTVATGGVTEGVDVISFKGLAVAEAKIDCTAAVLFCAELTGAMLQETKEIQRVVKSANCIVFVIGCDVCMENN